MNHQAIYNAYPTVKRIEDVESGVIAYDADNNEVVLTLMWSQLKQLRLSMHGTWQLSVPSATSCLQRLTIWHCLTLL